jgi:uncharacterized protein
MRVLISGASGLVGTALRTMLTELGDDVHALVRRSPTGSNEVQWDPANGSVDVAQLEGFDVVYHLAGESIAEGRWTAAKKARIRDSRVQGTTLLSEALAKLEQKPSTLVSASAIGYYGNRGDEELSESSAIGEGYLPDVSAEWEGAARAAGETGIRVVNPRIGIVLSKRGGALAKMLLPFKMGVGGIIGPGTQYMSWITLEDLVRVLHHCATNGSLSGPVNAVAPGATTNEKFTKAIGRALSRPTVLPMPALAARIAFGEMGDALLLGSTRVTPRKLFKSGFAFHHSNIDQALQAVLAE